MKPAIIAAMVLAAGTGWGSPKGVILRPVIACVEPGEAGRHLSEAKFRAGEMFRKIGVAIEWQDGFRKCPADAIHITFTINTPESFKPRAFAYATPFEGTSIRVLYDRIEAICLPAHRGAVMAHVLAHEITHILQGAPHHTGTGLMKAVWDSIDIDDMGMAGLKFTAEDIQLINAGLNKRAVRIAEAAPRLQPPSTVGSYHLAFEIREQSTDSLCQSSGRTMNVCRTIN